MEETIIAYIDNELAPDERQKVEQKIAESSEWKKAYTELKFLLDSMAEQKKLQPSKQLSQNFYQFLQEVDTSSIEETSTNNKRLPFWRSEWQIAAAVAILLIGIGFGTLWQHNKLNKRNCNN